MELTNEITKEKAIDLIIKNSLNTTINVNIFIDIADAVDKEDLNYMVDCALDDVSYLKEEAEEIYETIQKEKEKLNKLPRHEIFEMGEELGLWKLKEKQKRLNDFENDNIKR